MNRQVNLSTAATTATPVSTLIRTTAPVGAPHTTPSGRTSLPGILCVVIILDHQCNSLFFFTTILFVLLILWSHSHRKKYNTIMHFFPSRCTPAAPRQCQKMQEFPVHSYETGPEPTSTDSQKCPRANSGPHSKIKFEIFFFCLLNVLILFIK